jgi:WD40 repeat protein
MIAVGGMTDNTTQIYETLTYSLIQQISPAPLSNSASTTLKFNPNNSLLAIGYATGGIKIVNITDWSVVKSWTVASSTRINSVDFSPDLLYFVVCSNWANAQLIVYSTSNWNNVSSVGVNAGNQPVIYSVC